MKPLGWTATAVGVQGFWSTEVVTVQVSIPGNVGADAAKESAVGKLMMAHPQCKLLTVVAMEISIKEEE